MANGWTGARRKRQAEAIMRWRRWDTSTGPRTPAGRARVARNAYRGGEREKFRALVKCLNALMRDHVAWACRSKRSPTRRPGRPAKTE
jgi:hypothetical protein